MRTDPTIPRATSRRSTAGGLQPWRWAARLVLAAACLIGASACTGGTDGPGSTREDADGRAERTERSRSEARRQIAQEVRSALLTHVLDAFYFRAVDRVYGGYLSDFGHDWERLPPQEKFIVTQARHVWTLSRAAEFLTERRSGYLEAAEHGVSYLRDTMWDERGGGFVSLVTQEGELNPTGGGFTQGKTAYGNAFAIYGLAAYADVSGDTAALGFAQRAFRWLDEHMHDPDHGGYFQFVDENDRAVVDGLAGYPPKDQNSSIHLLEAFTELYRVWPDDVVRERLDEMLVLVRDTMVADDGYLRLFFERDWTPVSHRDSSEEYVREHIELDHVSYGHDVETAYLMLEAAHALGLDDAPTLAVGKRMVDHALEHGWDEGTGGFFDGGYYFEEGAPPEIVLDSKAWWAQAEGLNTLLLMADLYPDDPNRYYDRFEDQWEYIQEYLLDEKHGGWYQGGLDRNPDARTAQKASIWKAGYHDGRALMNVLRVLEADAADDTAGTAAGAAAARADAEGALGGAHMAGTPTVHSARRTDSRPSS